MSDCLFCNIVNGDIPARLVHRDELITAFRDINAQAPVHILIVPNRHLAGASQLSSDHGPILTAMFMTAAQLARAEGIDENGYRLVINEGPDAGQSVFHLHLHLLGGRRLNWPPG